MQAFLPCVPCSTPCGTQSAQRCATTYLGTTRHLSSTPCRRVNGGTSNGDRHRHHNHNHGHLSASLEPMVLSEENIEVALLEMKQLLGSMFGNSSENLDVGITGDVEFVGLDGPIVVLRLKGRFWHKRADVLSRVSNYLVQRIPEICDVEAEDPQQLEDSEQEGARMS